jgi:hypothetical protein
MTKEEKDFYIHKKYGKSPSVQKPKPDVWQLVFKSTGEKIIHGSYSLCVWKQKQLSKPQQSTIVPYKK